MCHHAVTVHRTHTRPSPPVMQRLVALAARAAAQLEQLLSGQSLRPQPSTAQHSSTTATAAAAAEGPSEDDWLSLFQVPLSDFDALVSLRKEALPRADRALPGASAALSALAAKDAAAETLLEAVGAGRKGKRRRGADEVDGGVDGDEHVDKRARVVLRAFPQQVGHKQHDRGDDDASIE